MPFLLTLGVLVAAAAAFLLHQFRSGAFRAEEPPELPASRERGDGDAGLKAA
jgi:hypothetical protein